MSCDELGGAGEAFGGRIGAQPKAELVDGPARISEPRLLTPMDNRHMLSSVSYRLQHVPVLRCRA
jgi:hypothetical protein